MAAILDPSCWISGFFLKIQESAKKEIKSNKGTLVWDKKIEVAEKKYFLFILKLLFSFSEKDGCYGNIRVNEQFSDKFSKRA